MSEQIQQLQEFVESAHACRAVHLASMPVHEVVKGQTVWEGVVEIFKLDGYPGVNRCYAWSYQLGEETRYETVLKLPPVTCAQSAVHSALAARVREG